MLLMCILSLSFFHRIVETHKRRKFEDFCANKQNIMIFFKVREANRQRSLLTNSQKREIGLATMLLCVVAVFFIFNILAMVVNIFEAANILVDEMTRVSNLLVSVNSSVNFIIYCIFGDKFQRLFLRHFCCCCRPGRGRSQSGKSFYRYISFCYEYNKLIKWNPSLWSREELSWSPRKFHFNGQHHSTNWHSQGHKYFHNERCFRYYVNVM